MCLSYNINYNVPSSAVLLYARTAVACSEDQTAVGSAKGQCVCRAVPHATILSSLGVPRSPAEKKEINMSKPWTVSAESAAMVSKVFQQ